MIFASTIAHTHPALDKILASLYGDLCALIGTLPDTDAIDLIDLEERLYSLNRQGQSSVLAYYRWSSEAVKALCYFNIYGNNLVIPPKSPDG